MQKWIRINEYAKQYLDWVYRYYSSHGQAYICTYYNLDLPNSIYDGTVLDAGAYHTTGELSGLAWRKIIYLPVYNIDQIQPVYNAGEGGYRTDQMTSFNFPTEYKIQPLPHDFVLFEQDILHGPKEDHKLPLYEVSNLEKATATDRTFWKVSMEKSGHTVSDIEEHLSGIFVFLDFNKQIYTIEEATQLFKLLEVNKQLSDVAEDYFNSTSGYYFMESD